MSPRSERGLRTWFDVLVYVPIDVAPKTLWIDTWCVPERAYKNVRRYEVLTDRLELADWDAITRHHEVLATNKRAHDLPAVVAQLSLTDPFRHSTEV